MTYEQIHIRFVWTIATIAAITIYELDLNLWQNLLGGTLSYILCRVVIHVLKRWEAR